MLEEDKVMNMSHITSRASRKQAVTALEVLAWIVTALWAASARATSSSGVTPSNRVVSAAAPIDAHLLGNGLQLKVSDDETCMSSGGSPCWDKAPIDILNITQTFAPGGYSGWHTHAGPGFVIVVQGTITIETAVDETTGVPCSVDYPAGSVLFEGGPTKIHNAINNTDDIVVLDAYFFLPAKDPPGSNSRIDEPVQYGSCTTSQ